MIVMHETDETALRDILGFDELPGGGLAPIPEAVIAAYNTYRRWNDRAHGGPTRLSRVQLVAVLVASQYTPLPEAVPEAPAKAPAPRPRAVAGATHG